MSGRTFVFRCEATVDMGRYALRLRARCPVPAPLPQPRCGRLGGRSAFWIDTDGEARTPLTAADGEADLVADGGRVVRPHRGRGDAEKWSNQRRPRTA